MIQIEAQDSIVKRQKAYTLFKSGKTTTCEPWITRGDVLCRKFLILTLSEVGSEAILE